MKGMVQEEVAAEINAQNKGKLTAKQQRLLLTYEEKEDEGALGWSHVLEVLVGQAKVMGRS